MVGNGPARELTGTTASIGASALDADGDAAINPEPRHHFRSLAPAHRDRLRNFVDLQERRAGFAVHAPHLHRVRTRLQRQHDRGIATRVILQAKRPRAFKRVGQHPGSISVFCPTFIGSDHPAAPENRELRQSEGLRDTEGRLAAAGGPAVVMNPCQDE